MRGNLASPRSASLAMIEPQRIGRFLTVDRFGHVQPDVADSHIGDRWRPVVELVVRSLMQRNGVRSVYIRGSIPRGLAIENVSDADFMYFSEVNFEAEDNALQKSAAAEFPFVNGLELSRLDQATFDRIHRRQRRPYFHMLLKTQCLFLAGEDIARTIEPFKIGPDLVSHVFSLAGEFSRLPKWLEEGRNAGDEQSVRRWFSRRIVRAGFEVTLDRSDHFTRDLYLCYEDFAKFYPDWAAQMRRVLINCLNGEETPLQYQELVTFLASEGMRLGDGALAS
jgi:uncharacterized protein